MRFQTVPVQITGASYQSRSRPLSSQRTVNWYPQASQQAKEPFVLLPFAGLLYKGTAAGADRGFERMAGTSLFEINEAGTHTLRGTVAGTDRCIMANDGINLYIVSSNIVYRYSTDTNLITIVTDVNIAGAQSVDFINNQFLYTKTKFTTVSNVGDGASASGLNIIGEETEPDNMVRDFVFDELIYRFGVRSIVTWYNSGQGNPPIEKLLRRYTLSR